jgi:hypothetical protein
MFKRISSVLMSFVLSFSYLAVLTPATTFAAADVCTWTGGGADANFTTALNWDCSVDTLESGDSLVFDASTVDFDVKDPVNDMVDATFTSITFLEDAPNNDRPTISGTAFSLSGDIINVGQSFTIENDITLTTDSTFGRLYLEGNINLGSNTLTLGASADIYGAISGAGNIIVDNATTLMGENTFTGTVSVTSSGSLYSCTATGLGTTAGATTVASNGYLGQVITNNSTFAEPLTIGGDGGDGYGALVVSKSCSGSGGGIPVSELSTPESYTATLSNVTLSTNAVVSAHYKQTIKFTGATLGGFTVTMPSSATNTSGKYGTIIVNGTNETYTPRKITIDAETENTDYNSVYSGETITVNGTTEEVILYDGATLKGSGTITAGFAAYPTSTVAPGNSPGCLKSGTVNMSGSTFQVEIAGATVCTGYDQLQVTGSVYLYVPIIELSFPSEDYLPEAGTKFVVISNDEEDAVNGTFKDLEEGATFESNGGVFGISYVGGDGNDVEITVITVPTTPDTGFSLAGNNPIATLMATTLLAGAMLATSRKYAKATVKK